MFNLGLFKRTASSLQERQIASANQAAVQARLAVSPALEPEDSKKARRAEIAARLTAWVNSPGLRPPG